MATKSKKSELQEKLQKSELDLIAKHGDKIVPGSIRRSARGKHVGKFTVEINTIDEHGEPDGKTLRVATSDVHQVHHQPDVTRRLYIARKNERARQRRAEARVAV